MQEKTREDVLEEMLRLIRKKPGIRPREMHAVLELEHSARLRNTLIARELVRKERKGNAVHYYPVN